LVEDRTGHSDSEFGWLTKKEQVSRRGLGGPVLVTIQEGAEEEPSEDVYLCCGIL